MKFGEETEVFFFSFTVNSIVVILLLGIFVFFRRK